jgi:hypothetical protein
MSETLTIQPGSYHLVKPEGRVTVRNLGPAAVWYSGANNMDNLMNPSAAGHSIRTATLFVVLPSAKHHAELEIFD